MVLGANRKAQKIFFNQKSGSKQGRRLLNFVSNIRKKKLGRPKKLGLCHSRLDAGSSFLFFTSTFHGIGLSCFASFARTKARTFRFHWALYVEMKKKNSEVFSHRADGSLCFLAFALQKRKLSTDFVSVRFKSSGSQGPPPA